MRLRASLIAPAIDPSWFSQFTEALERAARTLEFGTDGHMSPPTSLRLVSGVHATRGARYELANTLPTGATSNDDLVVDEWSSNVIAVTNTDNDDVSNVRFTRDITYGLKRFDVEMTDRATSGLALHAYADTQKVLTNDGMFATCKITHKIAIGEVTLKRTAVEGNWRIDVEIRTHGRGALRPILALLLVVVRPFISRWLRRGVKRITQDSIPKVHEQLKRSPTDAAHEAVHTWLASS